MILCNLRAIAPSSERRRRGTEKWASRGALHCHGHYPLVELTGYFLFDWVLLLFLAAIPHSKATVIVFQCINKEDWEEFLALQDEEQ